MEDFEILDIYVTNGEIGGSRQNKQKGKGAVRQRRRSGGIRRNSRCEVGGDVEMPERDAQKQ